MQAERQTDCHRLEIFGWGKAYVESYTKIEILQLY